MQAIHDIIAQNESFVITTHANPDGDAIGSSLGLYFYLKNLGKTVYAIIPNEYPKFIGWLPGIDHLINFEQKRELANELIRDTDVLFCLDYNAPQRSGELETSVTSASATKVMIDHHLDPADFCDVVMSNPKSSSTAEMVYELCHNTNAGLNLDALTNLYVGVTTDTGGFQFSSTTVSAHDLASEFIKKGGNPGQVFDLVYNSFERNKLKFFGYCINRRLHFIPKRNAAYFAITRDDLLKYNIQTGGTEGLVNYALKVADVTTAVLFKEDTDKIKISFRSKGEIDVSALARTYFNGGGHRNAAGGRSMKSLEDTVSDFKSALETEGF